MHLLDNLREAILPPDALIDFVNKVVSMILEFVDAVGVSDGTDLGLVHFDCASFVEFGLNAVELFVEPLELLSEVGTSRHDV